MQSFTLTLHQAHKGLAPAEWRLSKSINIQRLYYIIGGTGFYRHKGEDIQMLPGHFYLFASNIDQEFYTFPSDPIDHIYFDFYSTPPIISSQVIDFEPCKRLSALAGFLESSIYARKDEPTAEYGELLSELLRVTLMTLSTARPIPFMSDPIVSDTLEFIRLSYFEPITVTKLAERLGFEVNYFIRRFRMLTGVTPYAYLRAYRLERARELIDRGETVARAAISVGYENASSLSRALSESRRLKRQP